jgi:predicted esterase
VESEPSPVVPSRWSAARAWARRNPVTLVAIAIAAALLVRIAPRPSFLPLAASVDGPPPARAAAAVVFLHGRGGTLGRSEWIVNQLREAGLPADVAIVRLEAPLPMGFGFGRSWGDTREDQVTSRARVRARLRELLDGGSARVVIAGFSQGAGVAIDLAVEEPRIGALASFSPCYSWLREQLPKKDDLRILLAHGKGDAICAVDESRSLAQALEAAHRPARYIEFDGAHTVPAEAVRALVELTMRYLGRAP